MKIKDGYLVRQVAGSNIVVPVGEKVVDFNGIMTLNDTGMFLWSHMSEDTDREALATALLEEYDVDRATALADIDAFLAKLGDVGIVE